VKQRVADFIADYLSANGVSHVFSVVGGGAMHLNNAFAIHPKLTCIYNHHEQASALAAEGYARIDNKIAAVCVTSGPGGTNALTGVLCAYQDNQPMIVISGQVRYDITVESTGLNLRQFGEQEYYIVESVRPMTKYAVMVKDADSIGYHLSKALFLATSGRRGPTWVDVPLNIQGQIIETENLAYYTPESESRNIENDISVIAGEIERAERPVILAGSAIRASGCYDTFRKLVETMGLPVLCPTSIVDVFEKNNPVYYGMFGVFGGRAGNFIIQNADLIVALGCRMSFKQIGFNFEHFAPESKKIVVDIDPQELKKRTLSIDIPIIADVADVVERLRGHFQSHRPESRPDWIAYCNFLKGKFAAEYNDSDGKDAISAYYFADVINRKAGEDSIVVVGNNCAAVSMLQVGIESQGQRIFGNVNCGTMGYDLPAAIGAAVAAGRSVICATGEGSVQMNMQELQTIVHNHLPIKLVVFNNNSYQAIVQTQTNFFNGRLAGCNSKSGISFPSFEKLAFAYGLPYRFADTNADTEKAVEWLLHEPSCAVLELRQMQAEPIRPKLSSKRADNGQIVSPMIDDLAPFLDADEYASCQYANFAGMEK
jgi:acetolactate synthase-1/2/3 large subunit